MNGSVLAIEIFHDSRNLSSPIMNNVFMQKSNSRTFKNASEVSIPWKQKCFIYRAENMGHAAR